MDNAHSLLMGVIMYWHGVRLSFLISERFVFPAPLSLRLNEILVQPHGRSRLQIDFRTHIYIYFFFYRLKTMGIKKMGKILCNSTATKNIFRKHLFHKCIALSFNSTKHALFPYYLFTFALFCILYRQVRWSTWKSTELNT